jgi:hypothetical protein
MPYRRSRSLRIASRFDASREKINVLHTFPTRGLR